MPELPESMAADANASEEDNLTAFYNDKIVPLYGRTPAEAETDMYDDYPDWEDRFYTLNGAVTYAIADFDNNGDVEMAAFILVSETDDNGGSAGESYRLHILLCDTVDGQISVIKDMPVISQNNGLNEGSFLSQDRQQICLADRSICYDFMRIYTIDRDDKVYILITCELASSRFSDGYAAGADMYEVTSDDILLCSAYAEEPGSSDTTADEVTYENGVEVSRITYYMFPESYGLPEDRATGIEHYIDRLGLERTEFGYFDEDQRIITDSSANTVACMSCFPVFHSDDGQVYPVSFRFESVT